MPDPVPNPPDMPPLGGVRRPIMRPEAIRKEWPTMPDPAPCPCSWLDKAKAISLVVAAVGGVITGSIGAWFGVANHGKIGNVENGQNVQVQKADEVKDALDDQTSKTAAKLDKIKTTAEKTQSAVADATGPTLWHAYKYLADVAADFPTPENKAKAIEAKKAYDDYQKKK